MNASLWQLAGWMMIHSLWLGAAVALAGGFVRLAARRAAPNARYAISLATLALLAAAPIAAAAWLSVNGVPQLAAIEPVPLPLPLGEGRGEGQQRAHAPIIDLAQLNPSPWHSGERLGEGPNPQGASPIPDATVENPSPSPSLQGRGISVPTSHQSLVASHLLNLISYLPTLWLIGAPLTFALLATGLVGSERLRRRATPLTTGPAFDACERLRHTLTVTRRVALAASDGVAQPILVGIVRPLILLPAAALAGWTPEQLDMVLLHELAHVRRWDNLANLVQRIIESLLFYHPAVWLVSRQVRRDREECCDAAVIRHTNRPHQYAELLVSIAAALRGGPAPSLAVASAMASHPLAGRIRRILNIEAEPMRITRRTLAATLLLPLLLAAAIFYSGASAQDGNPPPSKGGARGGIQNANQPGTVANSDQTQGDRSRNAKAKDKNDAKPVQQSAKAASGWQQPAPALPTQESNPPASQLEAKISELQQLLKKTETEIAELQIFVDIKQLISPKNEHIDQFLRKSSEIDPEVVAAKQNLKNANNQLQTFAIPGVPIDAAEVQRLQTLRDETTQKIDDLQERFVKVQREKLNAIPEKDFPKVSAANIRKHQELQTKRDVYKLDLALAQKLLNTAQAPPASAGTPGSPNQDATATGSHVNDAPPTAKASSGSAAPVQEPEAPSLPPAVATATALSQQSGKPVLVHVLGRDSEPSQQFKDSVLADEKVNEFIAAHFVPVTILAEDEPAFISTYRIPKTPMDIFVGPHATGGISVPLDVDAYLKKLDYAHRQATAPPGHTNQAAAIRLKPGDAVVLKVVGAFPEAPLDGEFRIEPQGTLPLGPTYGRVAVAGKTLLEAEAAVKEFLSKTLTDVSVQLTFAEPPPTATEPTFLYDGKTFDQWRDLWKQELKTERRIEAINALAAFARAGRGEKAIDAILDVAEEYDFQTINRDNPEGELKNRIIQTLLFNLNDANVSADPWIPLLLRRMAENPDKWRALALQLFSRKGGQPTSPQNVALLKQCAVNPAYGPNWPLLKALNNIAPQDEEVKRLIKEALAGKDPANAIHALWSIGFGPIDALPEQIELLFHEDPKIRGQARQALLYSRRPGVNDAIAARMLAILENPEQSARHADALRALAVIICNDREISQRKTDVSDEILNSILDRLTETLKSGPQELMSPALLALQLARGDNADVEQMLSVAKNDLSEERLNLIQQATATLSEEKKSLLESIPQ